MKIGHEKIERREGRLYFVGKDGAVYSVKRGGGGREKESKERIERKQGRLYYLGKSGYVEESMMSRGKRRVRA
jgi:hypothetical protein